MKITEIATKKIQLNFFKNATFFQSLHTVAILIHIHNPMKLLWKWSLPALFRGTNCAQRKFITRVFFLFVTELERKLCDK